MLANLNDVLFPYGTLEEVSYYLIAMVKKPESAWWCI